MGKIVNKIMTQKQHFCTKFFNYEQKSTYNVDLKFSCTYNKGAVRADSGRKNNKNSRRKKMNMYYAKSVLYAYPNIEGIMEQIDELVEKKALASMTDFTPALWQYERIISYTEQKDMLIRLKLTVDGVLTKFSEDETDCFDYKYFKLKPKEYYENFDSTSRAYFRKQIKLAKLFAKRLENAGIDDVWFENNCLQTDFFKELLKRVIEHEKLSKKNKSFKEKRATEKKMTEVDDSESKIHAAENEKKVKLKSA